MPDKAFCVIYVGFGRIPKNATNGVAFQGVSHPGASRVGADDVDIFRIQTGPIKSHIDALSLSLWIREYEIGRVGVNCVADNLPVYSRASRLCVFESLEGVNATSFGNNDSISILVERSGCFGRVIVGGKCALAGKTCKDPECMDAFRNAASESARSKGCPLRTMRRSTTLTNLLLPQRQPIR